MKSDALDAAANAQLIAHLRLVEKWSHTHNLTATRSVEEMFTRHTLDSLSLLPYLPASGDCADMGSGAGFPGLVLAIARRDLHFHLIEAQQKKASFLLQAAHSLALKNVSVIAERAERIRDQRFACITVRALASLAEIARLAQPLLAPGGVVLAMKAGDMKEELSALPPDWQAERNALPEAGTGRCVVKMCR